MWLLAGLTVVVALALFVGGIAVGAWLEHSTANQKWRKP